MEKLNVYQKLLRIQQELEVPKNRRNEFGGFNYRSAEDILAAVKPLLKIHECIITLSDELVHEGERYYITASASLIDVVDKGEIVVSALAKDAGSKTKMDDAQVTGSTSSYARKYALNGLLALDDAADPDGQDNSKNVPEKRAVVTEEASEPTERAGGDLADKAMVLNALNRYPGDGFLLSIKNGVEKYGHMTDKQRAAVESKMSQPYQS